MWAVVLLFNHWHCFSPLLESKKHSGHQPFPQKITLLESEQFRGEALDAPTGWAEAIFYWEGGLQ